MRRTPHLLLAGALALAAPLAACGGDDEAPPTTTAAGAGAEPSDSVTVGALDSLRFDEDAYAATAGEVTFTYVNEGSIAHTLLIRDDDGDKLDGFKLAVGDTDEGSVELTAGEYQLYCDIAGHGDMKATLTVE